jgi:hypothetical protein
MPEVHNTPGNESTPYYDANAEGLYFSSDFHTGLGGLDVFFIRVDSGNGINPSTLAKIVIVRPKTLALFHRPECVPAMSSPTGLVAEPWAKKLLLRYLSG